MYRALDSPLVLPRHASPIVEVDNPAPFDFLENSPSPSPSSPTMPGPTRTSSSRAVQPPRPPNAWILYRSDKLKQLPARPPGMPRRAQAEVSREISVMWKNETEAVRAHYERLAEIKKAQHQSDYPGYRYHPVSKAEKERIREEKRIEKEKERSASKKSRNRPTPYATGVIVPSPRSSLPLYKPDARFGPGGPSPPLSAASSPIDTSGLSELQLSSPSQHSPPHPSQPPSHASNSPPSLQIQSYQPAPSPSSRVSSRSYPLYYQETSTAANSPDMPEQQPTPASSLWHLPQTPDASGATPTASGLTGWSGVSNENQTLDASDNVTASFVEIESRNMEPWAPDSSNNGYSNDGYSNGSYGGPIHGLISSTGDPSIFRVSGMGADPLVVDPRSEIELALGASTSTFDPEQLSDIFSSFDFSFVGAASTFQPGPPMSSLDYNTSDTTYYDPGSQGGASQGYGSTTDMLDYVNLEPSGHQEPLVHHPHATNTHSMTVISTNSSYTLPPSTQSYVPPAGAANSSSRRVAGSWRPNLYSSDSPVERSSSSSSWEVPAR